MDSVKELFGIIFEDSELLVVNKPAGLVCHPTKTDAYSSLISRARLYLGEASRPQLVNRLDRETGGVTVIAKSDAAARQLRRLWEARNVAKEYLAIAHGFTPNNSGLIDAPTGKDQASRVAIKDCVREDGAPATTEYTAQLRFSRSLYPGAEPQPFTLLRVVARTGRKHQIRIHLQHLGYPIVGDKLYGGEEDLYLALVEDRLTAEMRARLILPYHALHARTLTFAWAGELQSFSAEPEPWFSEFYTSAVPHDLQ